VNGICGCGLPAHCCQPAVAGGFICADLRGELNTHLAPQAFFTQSSPVCEPLLQAFPFLSTLGEVTLHPLSQACCLFTAHVGGGSSPLSCGVFLPGPLSQVSRSWLLGACPCSCWSLSGPAWLVYLQFREGFLSTPFDAQCTPPSFQRVFIVLIAYYSVSLFSGGRSVCPGGYADLSQGCL
jgi:hypothetical protein